MNVGVYGHIIIGEDGRAFLYVGSATGWYSSKGLSGRKKTYETTLASGKQSHQYNAWRAETVGQSIWVAVLRVRDVVAEAMSAETLMDLRLTRLFAEAVYATRLRG
jgi:hypothetical protein